MNEVTWASLFDEYRSLDHRNRQELIPVARKRLSDNTYDDWKLLGESLKDEQLKWFVASIFAKGPVPKRLFNAFMRAGIDETNPSFNRQFIEPCIKTFGHRAVNEYLLDVVEQGTSNEIAGAVAALYWANMQIQFAGDVPEYTLEHATEESRAAYLELNDIWERKKKIFLETFVSNEDVQVRRQILPSLNLKKGKSGRKSDLVEQVIMIARQHPDEYIRHRVEVQLGNEHLLKPIPDRTNGGH